MPRFAVMALVLCFSPHWVHHRGDCRNHLYGGCFTRHCLADGRCIPEMTYSGRVK